ncbi:DUF222 domain-containing protein [Tsukamurella soli]|uniref:HNH nuclease domain-containing protein n=1 Tax=Tsukamurella soli TaxID=644556 RepID=A0ABP8J093_9ACTN
MDTLTHLDPGLLPGDLAAVGDRAGAGDVLRAHVIAENQAWAERVVALYVFFEECYARHERRILADGGDLGQRLALSRQERYAYTAIAARLRVTTGAARGKIDEAVGLIERLPKTFAYIAAGGMPTYRARDVLLRSRTLNDEQTRAFDTRLADELGRSEAIVSQTELIRICDALVIAIDPDAAEQQHEYAKNDRHVDFRAELDGMARMFAVLTASEARKMHTRLEQIANTVCPQDSRSKRARMADALSAVFDGYATLACDCPAADCPNRERRRGVGSQLKTAIEVLVVANASTLAGLDDDPAYLPGHGVITAAHARDLAARDEARLRGVEIPDYDFTAGEAEFTTTTIEDCADDPAQDSAAEAHVEDETRHETPAEKDTPSGAHGETAPQQADVAATDTTQPPAPDATEGADGDVAHTHRADQTHTDDTEPEGAEADSAEADDEDRENAGQDGSIPAAYRPNTALARYIRVLFPTCCFPSCDRPAQFCELDHRIPYNHTDPTAGGQTDARNMQPLCKFHHQAKTEGLWSCTRRPDGAIVWTDADGAQFVCNPSTTILRLFPDLAPHKAEFAFATHGPTITGPDTTRRERAENARKRRLAENRRILRQLEQELESRDDDHDGEPSPDPDLPYHLRDTGPPPF